LKEGERNEKELTVVIAASLREHTTVAPPNDLRNYADSGATIHLFIEQMFFIPGSIVECEIRTVSVADIYGEVILRCININIRLTDVLYIESLKYHLVSTGRLEGNGIEFHFRRNGITVNRDHLNQLGRS